MLNVIPVVVMLGLLDGAELHSSLLKIDTRKWNLH